MSLPHALLGGVQGHVGAVKVPIGRLDVQDLVMDISLKLGTLLVEAQARDQDTFGRAGRLARVDGWKQHRSWKAGHDLIGVHAKAAQERLLEADLERGAIRRIHDGEGPEIGRHRQVLIRGAIGDTGHTARGQRLGESARERRAGAVLKSRQPLCRLIDVVPRHAGRPDGVKVRQSRLYAGADLRWIERQNANAVRLGDAATHERHQIVAHLTCGVDRLRPHIALFESHGKCLLQGDVKRSSVGIVDRGGFRDRRYGGRQDGIRGVEFEREWNMFTFIDVRPVALHTGRRMRTTGQK